MLASASKRDFCVAARLLRQTSRSAILTGLKIWIPSLNSGQYNGAKIPKLYARQ
jgi:hypothetical protein